jgi:glyoxylase-like metal-dependent hydrolase (beta-lactamase superfamily II)
MVVSTKIRKEKRVDIMKENMRIQVKKLRDNIYLLDDAGEATGYLVLGENKAIVIDTMIGYENVYQVVRSLTDLPLMVINTHGHCDHIYGNVYFDKAYMNPADLPVAREHMNFPEFQEECEKRHLKMPEFCPIYPGDVIELGNQNLEIIGLPGHTPGGICLLLSKDKVLFTGDGINRHLWLQLPESSSLQDLAKNLDAIMDVKQKADWILHGHARGFEPISLLSEMRSGVQEILDGNHEREEPYKWFGGEAIIHYYGQNNDAIIYSMSEK